MADTTRDIELRLRARDLSTAELKQVIQTVNELSSALDKQLQAASRLEIKEKELRATLQQFDQAAKNLAGLDAIIQRYKVLSEQITRNQGDLQKAQAALEAHKAAMASGAATGRAAESALRGFEQAVLRAQQRIDTNRTSLERYDVTLKQAGVDTANLAAAEQQIIASATQVGNARTQLNTTIQNSARLEREAKEAAQATAKAQREAAEATKAQAAQLRNFNEETKRLNSERREARAAALQEAAQLRATLSERMRVNRESVAQEKARVDALEGLGRRTVDNLRRQMRAEAEVRQRPLATVPVPSTAPGGGVLGTGPNRGAGAPVGFLGLRPYELTNLGYQINDVVSGLVSGQNATQILAQQGGQFIQIFGRAALRWFPLVAAAIGAVSIAASVLNNNLRQSASIREFTALLETNKYSADQSAQSLTNLRKELRDLGVGWEDAGKAIRAAIDANVRPEKLQEVVLTARDMARVMGKDVPTATKELVEGLSGGEEAFNRLIALYPAINSRQADYIRGLIRSGQSEKAGVETLRILNEEYRKAAQDRLSPLEKATENMTRAWNRFLDKLGESKFMDSALDKITKLIEATTRLINLLDKIPSAFPENAPQISIGGIPIPFVGNLFKTREAPPSSAAPIISGSNQDITKQYFEQRGYPPNFVAGLMGNIQIESGFNPAAVGPKGHLGIAQWDAERRKAFDSSTDILRQLQVLDDEIMARIGERAKQFSGSVEEAAKLIEQKIEVSGGQKLQERIDAAKKFAGQTGGGVVSGPTATQTGAFSTAVRDQNLVLESMQAQTREQQRQIEYQKAFNQFKGEGKDDDQAAYLARLKVAELTRQQNATDFQQQQERNRQLIQDGRDRAAIEAAGNRAVTDFLKTNVGDYDKLYQIRKEGEAVARADLQKRRSETDQLDAAEKRVDEQRRSLLNQQKSALDKLNEATNLRYDNELKAIDKLKERQSTTSQAEIDSLKARSEENRKLELANNNRVAALQQANEALSTRRDLIQSYTKLEEAGEISAVEKERLVKEAYGLTRSSILEAADALQKYIDTNKDLKPDQVALYTAKIKELRAETKYIDPEFKALKKAIEDSFAANLEKSFNTIAEALGGLIAKTKSWKDVWTSLKTAVAEFFAGLLKDIATAIIKAEALKLIGSGTGGSISSAIASIFTGSGSSATAGASGLTSASNFSTTFAGSWAHSGAVVGRTALPTRQVPAYWFAGAPRHHSGTVVGLAPDEEAMILQRGEEILSKDNPRNILNSRGGSGTGPIAIRNVLVQNEADIPAAMAGAHGEKVVVAHIIRNVPTIRQLLKG